MHETALIMEVLKVVKKSAMENKMQRVTKITLSVGKLTMALPEALSFAFRILTQETMFSGAVLEIEEKELCLRCCDCGTKFSPEEIDFCCPGCSGTNTKILEGNELCILSYEGEVEELESSCSSKAPKGK